MKRILHFCFILFFLAFIGCSDSSEDLKEFDGSIESIESFISPETVNAMKNLGFVFNTGNTPPNIEGSYLMSENILKKTTVVPDYIPGFRFTNILYTFSNQNGVNLDFKSKQGSQISEGKGSFISGEGNKFSIYLKTKTRINNSVEAITVEALSGEYTDTGIKNLISISVMLDDKGDPDNVYIDNNTGRLFYDKDGFSPKQ
ncbi:hypothetical protein [Tenacibaculum holothuriorum]|uniref:hypothetical protein n=1 Tax=Tenacibaculum holothuriorum TaxID=1635173 RepID=UPI000A329BD5|nr:hypothetical protein [Tenacibaculum holothuriorum]